ncbi:MAG: COX15/CtaA family protein [Chloroflexota bacterium]
MSQNSVGRKTSLPHSHFVPYPKNPAAATWLGGWLLTVCFFIAVMIIFGGYVRLTRSGLSIVEWQVVTGVWPPTSEAAWEAAFEKYRQTPEFRYINSGMTLAEYKAIYYREYLHRLLGRLTGLAYMLPLLAFIKSGAISPRQMALYLGIGLLFALQGLLGWTMVKSGLVDRPLVNHYWLTAHLLLALLLFGGCFWMALDSPASGSSRRAGASPALKLAWGLLAALVLQMAYGGLVAGLKAGAASVTFPLIFGYLIPPNLWPASPWPVNLIDNPLTTHFIHRWLAFGVLALIIALAYAVGKTAYPRPVRLGVAILLGLVCLQIALGISVIICGVPLWSALAHQANGLAMFAAALFVTRQLVRPV